MEVSGQNGFKYDEEEKALKILLDTFGSAFSLEDIASAYQKASRNPDMAGEILSDMQRSSSTSTSHSWKEEARVEESSESSVDFSFERSSQEGRNCRSLKPKARPVSVGTVSSILGKGYVGSTPSTNGSCKTTKPMKLDANVVPMSAIWGNDEPKPNVSKHNQLHQDMEDFLFKMLGDGFQLDRNVIRDVLDSCGYDMQKSMGKLLDGSFRMLDERTNVAGESSNRFTEMNPKSEVLSSEKFQSANYHRGERSRLPKKGAELHGQERERANLQKEVLTALFTAHESSEESPRRTARDVNKFSSYGQVICEPLEDSREDFKYTVKFSELEKINEGADEDDYQNLRKAVKEYRVTMNEYYKAAIDAFAKGEHAKAEKLLDEGHFFLKKAREADEESNKMILETGGTTEAEAMVLDLHDHDAREAIRLLKCHLSSLSGIPSFEYLKVIIDASDQNTSKRSCRKLVMKLLEKESIQWSEGENAGTILIRLNSVERKRLSFIKK
ncbi:hypothetical protein L6164_036658 [Bauhinia variegata]|uniref:Uncharacterized protein n=1 Tax=Bauhinia variegata TaxID=167791 RepID=A0ACB9KHM0_BAUVA|nr:hypothetical protein L6164_036658 [Bauhinia variegata]